MWKIANVVTAFLAPVLLALNVGGSYAQTQTALAPRFATKYFLDAPPTKDDLANLPSQARDVTVAKVRMIRGVWLGGRDQSGLPPPPKKYIYWAQVELLDILRGSAKRGDQLEVFVATAPDVGRYITPSTPAMQEREYFVVMFADAENKLQLFGLPASQNEFERWEAEIMDYIQIRDHLRVQ
jgi:hypothetical protein